MRRVPTPKVPGSSRAPLSISSTSRGRDYELNKAIVSFRAVMQGGMIEGWEGWEGCTSQPVGGPGTTRMWIFLRKNQRPRARFAPGCSLSNILSRKNWSGRDLRTFTKHMDVTAFGLSSTCKSLLISRGESDHPSSILVALQGSL